MYNSTNYTGQLPGDVLVTRVVNELQALTVDDILVDGTVTLGQRLGVTPEMYVVRAASVQNVQRTDKHAPSCERRGVV